MPEVSPPSEAVILIKAASQPSGKPNEIVYCAGITPEGNWIRLYPVSFRKGADALTFKRWDRVSFTLSPSQTDTRTETNHVKPHSMQIIGEMPLSERRELVNKYVVTSLKQATAEGKSLALLKPRDLVFAVKRKTPDELKAEQADYDRIASQIGTDALKPQRPFPYKFNYKYSTDDGPAEGTYQDWEMGETFSNLSETFGEALTLSRVIQVYGKEYPQKGIVFLMSRNGTGDEPWLISGIISMDEINSVLATNLNLSV